MGCNSTCAYCIVPAVRGREQSRRPGDIVAEVTRLAADGVREITLLGQNVNSWGRDLAPDLRTEFGELLRACDAVDGIERIRFTSPHPKDFREPVIAAMAECDAVCEHVHLPLQSGSTRLLKAMRRTYSPRALPRARRAAARRRSPTSRSAPTSSSASPARPRTDFRADARGRRGGALRQRVHVHLLAAARAPRRPTMPDQVPEERQARAARAARRGRPAHRRRAERRARRPGRGGARRGREPHRRRRSCAAARAATRPSTSPAPPTPGELVDVADRGRHLDDAARPQSPPQSPRRPLPERVLAWDGCLNVRDLGGLPTEDGGETRFGASSGPTASAADRGGLARARRLRRRDRSSTCASTEELDGDPPRGLPVEVVHVPLFGERDEGWSELDRRARGRRRPRASTRVVYLDVLEQCRPELAPAIEAVADAAAGRGRRPLRGGKDRTGLVRGAPAAARRRAGRRDRRRLRLSATSTSRRRHERVDRRGARRSGARRGSADHRHARAPR